MMRGAVILALMLAACTPVEAAPPARPEPVRPEPVRPEPVRPEPGNCGAPALQSLVGQPASVLQTMRFAGPVRIIRPRDAVTMDYSADRLNIHIGPDEVIARVRCG